MDKLILQVRTKDNLLDLLAKSESGDWIIANYRVHEITHIQVVNFAGTQMIESVFDRNTSYRTDSGRLVVKFLDAHIINCSVQFDGQNPVSYI